MEIKLGLLGVRIHALEEIAGPKNDAVLTWKLYRIHKKLIEESKDFENARIELCKKCAEKDDKGEPVTQEVDGRTQYVGLMENQEFLDEVNTLSNETVYIEISPLDIEMLEEKGIKLSLKDIYELGELLKGEE